MAVGVIVMKRSVDEMLKAHGSAAGEAALAIPFCGVVGVLVGGILGILITSITAVVVRRKSAGGLTRR